MYLTNNALLIDRRTPYGASPGSLNSLRHHGLKSIGMTSNGLVLHRRLPQLIDNGLTHLNLR